MTLHSLIVKAYEDNNHVVVSYLEKLLSEGRKSIVIDNDDKYIIDNKIDVFLKDNTFCTNWPEGDRFQAFFSDSLGETLLKISGKYKETKIHFVVKDGKGHWEDIKTGEVIDILTYKI